MRTEGSRYICEVPVPKPAGARGEDCRRQADICHGAAQVRAIRYALAPASPTESVRADCDSHQPMSCPVSPRIELQLRSNDGVPPRQIQSLEQPRKMTSNDSCPRSMTLVTVSSATRRSNKAIWPLISRTVADVVCSGKNCASVGSPELRSNAATDRPSER